MIPIRSLLLLPLLALPAAPPLLPPSLPGGLAPTNGAVLFEAFSHPAGGGYRWKGTGVPEEVRFEGKRVLKKGSPEGTYCSGVTFSTVMKSAESLGLLAKKSLKDIQTFQRNWYGSTKASAEKQCAVALEELGVGTEVEFSEALPGDFVQFWRGKSGHSAVFLGWIFEGDEILGLHYWSSQKSTGGIGPSREFFSDAQGKNGKVDRKRTYFGRLGGESRSKSKSER